MAIKSFMALVLCAAVAWAGGARGAGGGGAMAAQTRVRAPELTGAAGWLNTDKPLSLAALRGKVVLLDFWTYGCINCIHVIPDLKRLEAKYAKELVVIGVHSAKFDNEKETENIRRIILRYERDHPVVNDSNFAIWQAYAVRAWPTLVLIDPAGYVVGQVSGEGHYDVLDKAIGQLVADFRKRGELNEQPLKLALERAKVGDLPLAFPGKVLADQASGRLFIADSNHNRIVVARLDGSVIDTIGTGARGAADGAFDRATFFRPQGLALDGDSLYVADTENHLIRRVDLRARAVTTVAGTGRQGRWLGEGQPSDALKTPLNSPWDLQLVGRRLFIAMAGPHQIWKLDLGGNLVSLFAGSGREARTDGPRLQSAFAQPSGLAADGSTLFVADSESNIIRAIDLVELGKEIEADLSEQFLSAEEGKPEKPEKEKSEAEKAEKEKTEQPAGRVPPPGEEEGEPVEAPPPTPSPEPGVVTLAGGDLFEFGDRDGVGDEVRLQHPLGVVHVAGAVFIADTYNHKIKRLDPATGEVKTFAGTGRPGQADGARASFYEPGGISYAAGKLYVADTNNHAVRVVDARTGETMTLRLRGLAPPTAAQAVAADADASASAVEEVAVEGRRLASDGALALVVEVDLPAGYHLNENAPHRVRAEVSRGAEFVALEGGKATFERASKDLRLPLRLSLAARGAGAAELRVRVSVYYCREDDTGTCRIKTLAWRVPVELAPGSPREINLRGKAE